MTNRDAWPVIFMLCAACSTAESRYSLEKRQEQAESWLKDNKIEGVVKCFEDTVFCDVVTRDPRTPFLLVCPDNRSCRLVH